jgi:UDP-GlcNAc:undecaprenyl-phosphate/decaprenyl-phosphate GlcNAc-1-phosphate transferase
LAKSYIYILISFVFLFFCEIVYLNIAKKYKIFSPNNFRSSHNGKTVIGGGFIFFLAVILHAVFFGFEYRNIIIGTFFLSLISYIDDLGYVKHSYRLLVHLLSLTFIIPLLQLDTRSYIFVFSIIILGVGVLNSFNFIDGINGMLALLSFVILGSLYYINISLGFVDPFFILMLMASLLVFMIFNFRTRALCFAGDIGSISIGYLLFFLILTLIIKTSDFTYLLLFCIPGIDSAITLFYRIVNNKNILFPHRTFLFHLLVLRTGLSHLSVSLIYAFLQILINTGLLFINFGHYYHKVLYFCIIIVIVSGIYLILRNKYYTTDLENEYIHM